MSAKTDESGVETYTCLNYFRFLDSIAEWEKSGVHGFGAV
jgi:hypothetical protein